MGYPFKILRWGIIKVTPFIRNAKEILNNDKFEVLKVIRYLQNFS